ncbi:metalloregulator ArsR/SmtB family transcription factor [Eubacteriales bacterium OttesenSCG-928-M02]|nr:metalloregulator ArsR/SmtB family transcription factor [Eubacteriales bacterium OttesenSCG-928-M02]
MENRYKANAKVFKAFCDENRLQILALLQSGEKCACVLLEDLHISQSTLSHHMKILCESGIVTGRKEGKWTHYSISANGASAAQSLLQELTTVHDTGEDCICG